MKGLIYKDFALIMHSKTMIILLLLVFACIGIINHDLSFTAGFLSGALNFLFPIMIINCVSFDEQAHWSTYACTLPISREQLVLSRYCALGIISLSGLALSVAITAAIGVSTASFDLSAAFLMAFFPFALSISLVSVLLPVNYKFGPEKSRFIMIALFILPTTLGPLLMKNSLISQFIANLFDGLQNNGSLTAPALLGLAVLVAISISYCFSVHIIKKKEL